MRLVFVHLVTVLLSFFLISFGVWTYTQALYHEKVRKDFQEKAEVKLDSLNSAKLLSDKLVIIKGIIGEKDSFKGMNNKDVVLERYREEKKPKDSKKDWQSIKENSSFKVIPFRLYDNDKKNSILIDSYEVDKTFLGEPEVKQEDSGNDLIKKSLWQFSKNQEVYVMGKLEDKAGQFVISNPNLDKSIFSGDFVKEPFIITKDSPSTIAKKAKEIGGSIFYSSIALVLVSIFVFFTSLMNIFRAKRQFS